MIRRIITHSKLAVKNSKRYAQDIGLGIGEWIKVFVDYEISRAFYDFSPEDYFVVGNGYTLSRYEKKRFFTDRNARRWLWYNVNVNDPQYIHFLRNTARGMFLNSKTFKPMQWLCYKHRRLVHKIHKFAK